MSGEGSGGSGGGSWDGRDIVQGMAQVGLHNPFDHDTFLEILRKMKEDGQELSDDYLQGICDAMTVISAQSPILVRILMGSESFRSGVRNAMMVLLREAIEPLIREG
jgi:hypothetical protein